LPPNAANIASISRIASSFDASVMNEHEQYQWDKADMAVMGHERIASCEPFALFDASA
jgi:hypothetical protein